jgi:hypothetical protein
MVFNISRNSSAFVHSNGTLMDQNSATSVPRNLCHLQPRFLCIHSCTALFKSILYCSFLSCTDRHSMLYLSLGACPLSLLESVPLLLLSSFLLQLNTLLEFSWNVSDSSHSSQPLLPKGVSHLSSSVHFITH